MSQHLCGRKMTPSEFVPYKPQVLCDLQSAFKLKARLLLLLTQSQYVVE